MAASKNLGYKTCKKGRSWETAQTGLGPKKLPSRKTGDLEIDELAHELSPVLTNLSPGNWMEVVPDCQDPGRHLQEESIILGLYF